MAGDDLFTRYLEIGASILGMTRERAESIVRDLVASGEVAKGQATKAADWLVERGKTGSEELAEVVRREIRQQVTALGLATKADIDRLQAEIDELKAASPAPALTPRARTVKAREAATKPAGITRSGSARTRSGAAPPGGGAQPAKG